LKHEYHYPKSWIMWYLKGKQTQWICSVFRTLRSFGRGFSRSKHDTQDSIFNGANDDAAGTTVILLAEYFRKWIITSVQLFSGFCSRRIGRLWF
jgi:hypothetical protein